MREFMRNVNLYAYRIANHFISRPDHMVHRILRKVVGDRNYYEFICRTELLPIIDDYKGRLECNSTARTVVLQFDGKIYNTGLADRLRAITSIYHFCKQNNIDFKLNFTEPFHLNEFLVPNKYDWHIDEKEICYSSNDSYPVAVISQARIFGEEKNLLLQMEQLESIKTIHKNQIHLYSNCFCYDDYFNEDFKCLFKLSNYLEAKIQTYLAELNNQYVSASFRFTQLLGDLKDTFGKPLEKLEQQRLIEKCLGGLARVHQLHQNCDKILVTSDSSKFICEAEKLPYVYIVPGSVGHIAQSDDRSVAERAFVDMFLISKAQKAYMLRTKEMFKSGFAKRGAMIGNIEFEEIVLE